MDITNINHVGMIARDLEDVTRRYEAMGFMLTPYSPHSAAWKPGEPVQPQGSGNRCVMFADNYLEILASENPSKPAERMTNFLRHHQGGHIICFDSDDCNAVDRRLHAAGIETSGVIPLQREIDTPGGVRTARFERVQFAPKDTPEGYIQAARHLTPDYIYQPRYIAHPNGATRLAETYIVALDAGEMAQRYATYLGAPPVRLQRSFQFRLPRDTLLNILPVDHASVVLPGTLLPPLPGIAAVSFTIENLGAQALRLASAGFTVVNVANSLLVPAEETCGLAVMFST